MLFVQSTNAPTDFEGDSSANDGLDEAATKATSSSTMDSAKHAKASPKASKLPRKTMESDDSDNESPRQRRKDVSAATETSASAKASSKKRPRKTMDDSDNEGPRKRRKDDPAATETTSTTMTDSGLDDPAATQADDDALANILRRKAASQKFKTKLHNEKGCFQSKDPDFLSWRRKTTSVICQRQRSEKECVSQN